MEGKTAELALLRSIVPMHGLGPPAAGQVVVQMAGHRTTGGGGAFVFGMRRADSSWSNSSLEATAGGAQLQIEHQSAPDAGKTHGAARPLSKELPPVCSKKRRRPVSQLLDLSAVGVLPGTSSCWVRRLLQGTMRMLEGTCFERHMPLPVCRRRLSKCHHDAAGMRSLLSFSNTRALSQHSSATIAGSYSFGTGLGLQVKPCDCHDGLSICWVHLQRGAAPLQGWPFDGHCTLSDIHGMTDSMRL